MSNVPGGGLVSSLSRLSDPLQLALWREVSRHRDIERATQAIRDLLVQAQVGEGMERSAACTIEVLLVRRWREDRASLETVAMAGEPGGVLPARTSVPSPWRAALTGWAEPCLPSAWLSREETGLGRLVVPEGLHGPVAATPLVEEGRLVGVLVVSGDHRGALPTLDVLREVFTTALAHDQRLHELASLREAAEQDRAALLSRLGRQDVSEAIVGAETGLRAVLTRVEQVAPTDAPVLILGETGSGKEVVARAIHARSRRASGPFLRVNCGAIPSELIDSELFGHERGAFTGALSLRKGWFERADGGTLLLDEVAELPPAAQVRLLRVLQDGSFQRVGGERAHTADVRILAATHRDMAQMVQNGNFRQDLWYRVSVFPIHLPALRERTADIAALASHFAERAGIRLFGRPLVPTADDLARLTAYPWPGNVRELAAVIERAAILGDGHGLAVNIALGGNLPNVPGRRGAIPSMPVPSVSVPAPSQDADEPDTIRAALQRARGRIEGPFGAAEALGVNPHTLRSRMRRLGIEWADYRGGRSRTIGEG